MQANQRGSIYFKGIDLGWATADLHCDQDSIVIQAVNTAPPSCCGDGYLYRACIKWDPKAT